MTTAYDLAVTYAATATDSAGILTDADGVTVPSSEACGAIPDAVAAVLA